MKSGSSPAIAFGSVLQVVRKSLARSQADVAGSFNPKLSVAAVSMAESGSRPPKTEAAVRGFALALELDDDCLVELWRAMQGMVELEDWGNERDVSRWWQDLRVSHDADLEHHFADKKALKLRTPNEDVHAPSRQLFNLADAICGILRRLLGESWKVGHTYELGLRDSVEGRPAVILIELRTGAPIQVTSQDFTGPITTFACPSPRTRPTSIDATTRPKTESLSPDIAWILSAIEAMPARERAAVAGFIHGLQEGANLFSAPPETPDLMPESSVSPSDQMLAINTDTNPVSNRT